MSSHNAAPLMSLPISTDLPPTLTFLSNPISYYFNANPPYNNAALGAIIFTPPPQVPRLLLLQRVGGTDPHAFSDFWQIPSGLPKATDLTMLHALARIVFDQTGLRLASVITISGTELEPARPETGNAQRLKMLFVVEVAELHLRQLDIPPIEQETLYGSQGLGANPVAIALDTGKHRQHAWSREEDLKEFIKSGLYPIEEQAQYRMMLEAFVLHNQSLAYFNSLHRQAKMQARVVNSTNDQVRPIGINASFSSPY